MTSEHPTVDVHTRIPLEQYAFLYRLARTLPGTPTVGALVAECVRRQLANNPAAQPRTPAPTPDEVRDTRIRELIGLGWSKTRIAAECHVSIAEVAKVRKAMGLVKQGRPRQHESKTTNRWAS